MVNSVLSALDEDLRQLMSAYQGIVSLVPDNKRGATAAKQKSLLKALTASAPALSGAGDVVEDDLKQLIIISWRLMFAHEQAIRVIPVEKREAEVAKAEKLFYAVFLGIFKIKGDIKIVAYEGKPYEPNYPAEAINAEDFAEGEKLVIMETMEPALLKTNGQSPNQLLHFAKVLLASAQPQQQENQHVSRH